MIIVGYAIPGFLFAILLIVLFAGGIVLRLVPAARPDLGQSGRACPGPQKILDYFWHLALPLTAMALSAFATTTLLTKNSFLDEIRKQYVMTARAKGLTERQVLYGHVFRNAMLIVIAGFPGAFISAFFAGVAADRDDLLARRARPARLRVGAQPRLSGGLRHALHLLADRAGGEPDLRPHLHLDRSADRFRDARGLMDGRDRSRSAASRRSSRSPGRREPPPRRLSRCRRSTGGGWQNFKANRRGYWSLWIFLVLFVAVAVRRVHRQRPADHRLLQGRDPRSRSLVDYPESKFGGFLATTDYRDPFIQDEIHANGWMIWPPIRYSYRTVNNEIADAGAGAAVVDDDAGGALLALSRTASTTATARIGNWNWLGTDDQGRDVVARLIYGFRISVVFGLIARHHLLGHRRASPAPCRAISAAGSISASSASSRSGRRSRRSTCCSSSPR